MNATICGKEGLMTTQSKPEFKVIVAGSRSINDYQLLKEVMVKSNAAFKATQIISGHAKGVDQLGERWGKDHKIPVLVMPAKWNDLDVPGAVIEVKQGDWDGYYNSRAGVQRNEQMGDIADAAVILWDGKSNGTRHMIDYMKKLGKKVYVHIAKQKT